MALGYRASYLRWFTYTGCPVLKNVSARTDIFSRHLIIMIMVFPINPSRYLIYINFMYIRLLIRNGTKISDKCDNIVCNF